MSASSCQEVLKLSTDQRDSRTPDLAREKNPYRGFLPIGEYTCGRGILEYIYRAYMYIYAYISRHNVGLPVSVSHV